MTCSFHTFDSVGARGTNMCRIDLDQCGALTVTHSTAQSLSCTLHQPFQLESRSKGVNVELALLGATPGHAATSGSDAYNAEPTAPTPLRRL